MTAASIPASPRTGRGFRVGTGVIGAVILLAIALPCFLTLPWTLSRYEGSAADAERALQAPTWSEPLGTDQLGRSLLVRCLLGGAISLGIGVSAAVIAVVIGVTWGAISGYVGGRTDAAMMRIVDVIYGLPYILIVVLLAFTITGLADWLKAGAAEGGGAPPLLARLLLDYPHAINVVTLLLAIGAVSWLTMARVIRGQVLSLRAQPFVEAARACGVGPARILLRHLLPNLVGPIVVYTTLTVPAAILQESFLSFLGIGVQAPLPSWGNLAAAGMEELHTLTITGWQVRWWLILWPCLLLGLTLLALNFLGDALRARLDPRSGQRT